VNQDLRDYLLHNLAPSILIDSPNTTYWATAYRTQVDRIAQALGEVEFTEWHSKIDEFLTRKECKDMGTYITEDILKTAIGATIHAICEQYIESNKNKGALKQRTNTNSISLF